MECLHLGKFILLALLIVTGYTIYQYVMVDIAVRRDISGWLDRAGQATTAARMAEYIEKALEGLDKWGMKDGYWAWLYQTPDNNMAVARQVLDDLKERCLEIEQTQERGSMAYAESLEEIKRTFSSVKIDPTGWWLYNKMPWLYFWWVWLLPAWLIGIPLAYVLWEAPYKTKVWDEERKKLVEKWEWD